ncbi:hypothetical protein ACIP10_36225 [Streptomyces galbus]|uniref:hypothetical protein n=1 Tax=Streptomyces galbus TaxID=33898 RepID=UPI003829EA0C
MRLVAVVALLVAGDLSDGEERRTKALADALPALLSRVTRPGLRCRLLEQADDKQLAELAGQGVVVAADPPTILRAHRPTPGLVVGLARHPDQVDAAIGLLPGLHDTDLEDVVIDWDPIPPSVPVGRRTGSGHPSGALRRGPGDPNVG